MATFQATALLVRGPLQLLAWTLLAKVAGEWADLQEAQEGKEFADTVLHGGARQTPLVSRLQGETSLGYARGTLLNRSVSWR